MKKIKKNAFTLAEVLITLTIIGVVAAMTMPTLIQNHQEKVTVTKLKKAYSVMSQAYERAIFENGAPDNWDLIGNNNAQGAENALNMVAQYLNVLKNCGRQSGCAANMATKYLNGTNNVNFDTTTSVAKMILADGTFVGFEIRSADCTTSRGNSSELRNTCGNIEIDVNGSKPPNIFGKDIFFGYFTRNSIIPAGTRDETVYPFGSVNGLGSTAWVIMNENLDYLHCDNLSWDGPTKCH